MSKAARCGLNAIIGVLSRAETLPDSLTNGDGYWCSQMILTAYADAGIPFDVANGASPGDVVRLAETGASRRWEHCPSAGSRPGERRKELRVLPPKPCGTGFLCSARGSLQAGPIALSSARLPHSRG